jgi:aerotaxis receptor
LREHLRQAGFDTYDAFMRAALLAEVKSRQALLSRRTKQWSAEPSSAGSALSSIVASCGPLQAFLDLLVRRLDEYEALNARLAEKSHVVLDLAENVRLFSLNALLAATRLGSDGASLGAVASLMQTRSNQSDPLFQLLNEDVIACADLLSDMAFPVAAASLQVETLVVFVRELLEGGNGEQPSASDLGALAYCLADEIERLDASIGELDRRVRLLDQHVVSLRGDIGVMRMLELNGRIEAAHASESAAVVSLFRTIAEQIGTARHEMDDLARLSRFSVAAEATLAQRSRHHVGVIREQVQVAAGA